VEVIVKCKGQCVEQLVLCCIEWLVITTHSVLQDRDHSRLKLYRFLQNGSLCEYFIGSDVGF